MPEVELDAPLDSDRRWQGRRVAVVGGGLAGLSAARELARGGAEVVVYEAEDRLGGRACTDDLAGMKVDPGAQLYGSMYRRFLALVRDIGLGDALVRVPGRDALWRNGRAHDVIYGSVTSMVGSGGLPLTTKMRLGATYVPFLTRHAANLNLHAPERGAGAGLDHESIAEWGERELDRAFVESLVYPQLGAFYGSTPEETSAGFYHILARYGMDVSLYGVAGGIGRVAERLADEVRGTGGTVRTGTAVDAVELTPAGATIHDASATTPFDAVVAAIPAPTLIELLRGGGLSLIEWLEKVRYRPTLSLALVLSRPVRSRYFGLSFPRGATRNLAVLSLHENKGTPFPYEGGLMVAFPRPETAPDLVGLPSREILDRLLPEIELAFPGIRTDIVRARVYRWPVGTPVFYPGYLRHLLAARNGALEGDARIALAGDYLYGPSVEGAVSSGLAAAERIGRLLA